MDLVNLNILNNTYTNGSLGEHRWMGKSTDPKDPTTYLIDTRNFNGIWLVQVGETVEAEVVHRAKNGKFAYVQPTASAYDNGKARDNMAVEVIPATEKPAPIKTVKPTSPYGEYQPAERKALDVTDYSGLIAELEQIRGVIMLTRKYYLDGVHVIIDRDREDEKTITEMMKHWKGSLDALRQLGASQEVLKSIEDDLSKGGDRLAKIEYHRKREMRKMARDLTKDEKVNADFEYVLQGENLMSEEVWMVMAAQSYPFILWLLERGEIYTSKAHMRRLLDVIEEKAVATFGDTSIPSTEEVQI